MTRSLGDAVMLQAGVLPIPIITKQELAKEANTTYYFCVGSDGVFDVLTNNRVADIVTKTAFNTTETSSVEPPTMDAAALEVCNQAREAWTADLPVETKVDDVTCVVAKCTFGGSEEISRPSLVVLGERLQHHEHSKD